MTEENTATVADKFEGQERKVSWHTGWDCNKGNCTICRNHLSDLCRECKESKRTDLEDCILAKAKCNHSFHFHCISTHLKTAQNCPNDNMEWEFLKYGKYGTDGL